MHSRVRVLGRCASVAIRFRYVLFADVAQGLLDCRGKHNETCVLCSGWRRSCRNRRRIRFVLHRRCISKRAAKLRVDRWLSLKLRCVVVKADAGATDVCAVVDAPGQFALSRTTKNFVFDTPQAWQEAWAIAGAHSICGRCRATSANSSCRTPIISSPPIPRFAGVDQGSAAGNHRRAQFLSHQLTRPR